VSQVKNLEQELKHQYLFECACTTILVLVSIFIATILVIEEKPSLTHPCMIAA
jgi:hypothetical protein